VVHGIFVEPIYANMSFGFSIIIISSIALLILSIVSFLQVHNLKYQLWYAMMGALFAGMLSVVSLASENYTLLLWPGFVLLHISTKLIQISKSLH
ncbi:MAG: hypothetical protein ACK566_05285, partial [Bacteroidota bacterium]